MSCESCTKVMGEWCMMGTAYCAGHGCQNLHGLTPDEVADKIKQSHDSSKGTAPVPGQRQPEKQGHLSIGGYEFRSGNSKKKSKIK